MFPLSDVYGTFTPFRSAPGCVAIRRSYVRRRSVEIGCGGSLLGIILPFLLQGRFNAPSPPPTRRGAARARDLPNPDRARRSAGTPTPSAGPTTCGIVGVNPKAAPDAQRRTLCGPGEPVLTIEKATRASHWSTFGG